MKRTNILFLLIIPVGQVGLMAQTKDASARLLATGTTLPSTCTAGQLFFKSDATAGQNLYHCAATNTWTQGGGVRSISGSWGDLKSTTVLTASTTDAACDTAPMTGTIYGWSARVSPANADATFKIWKNASSTTDPTVADSINTAGIGITTGTRVSSTTLTDFTTLAVTVGDNICVNLSAVAGSPTYAAVKVLYR